ncbi:hypothetical protein V5O48_017998 [Marasmius crinis-equi]|uniref:Peroxidase n=1 Tax=Marasmius crinis-equi TaxID=585013 RepID=A0ABR3EME1_9AGAR
MKVHILLPFVLFLPAVVLSYTWPSWTDELEDIMYLQSGFLRRGFHDGISPCTFSTSFSPFRHGAAEWIRTAFHDAITHEKRTGQGGLDASLMYELDRPENVGNDAMNDTFAFFSGFQSRRASMADLLALGVYTSVRECRGPVIPFRAGRIDAMGAGVPGVPEPTTDLETTRKMFKKAGFDTADMIAMVACGHTLGGVHGDDFPEITGKNDESSFPRFDSTTGEFDNMVVTEYLSDNTSNVLVVGPHATNSDMRVFSSDKNATMRKLANPDTFRTTCASILQRMIETVPSSVTLTEPIQPVDIKPMSIQLSVTSATTLSFRGFIRVRMTERQKHGNPPLDLSLPYKTRQGKDGGKITAKMPTFRGGAGLGFDDWFQFYEFRADDIPSNTSISSFVVKYSNESAHTNGGGGFRVHDEILAQPLQSCILRNLTDIRLVAAVRNDRTHLRTYAEVAVKHYTPGILGARIEVRRVEMKSNGTVLGQYTFFGGRTEVDERSAFTQYDLVNGDVRVEFLSTSSFSWQEGQGGCPHLFATE